MNSVEIIQFFTQFKNASAHGHSSLIDFIINNKSTFYKLDYINSHNLNIKVIKSITKNSYLVFINIQSWIELYEQAELNRKVIGLVSSEEVQTPSMEMMNSIAEGFFLAYRKKITAPMVHFFSATNDNYLLYCLGKWLQETKNEPINPILKLNDIQIGIINKLNELQNTEEYFKYYNQIVFPKLNFKHGIENNEVGFGLVENVWNITYYPIYYPETNIYSLAITYHGMGWNIVLSLSLSLENSEKPFFFRLDGGSNGYDREINETFFKNKNPPKNLLFNFDEIINIIKNGTINNYLFNID